ncbi:hypothetical protein CY34DRAFT_25453 [Suillus luteus UH-Slu-Lm8-n1]|uniref:Uncharacterized protein n=1 Tax=Suillus luteus UH-Slu-Lm8-n1 TaxID=930992 RepID=A0A0C9ZN06_9AGAM|nr:hypothetical protein CY34DRAFT_25453 [Suillus luteus UH-Slu-Lm8-n1]
MRWGWLKNDALFGPSQAADVNLGSTNQTYSSALNSYVTFCDLHHPALEPTANTLSLFVTFMLAHINPRSVDNYLSGICSLLEDYYPLVWQSGGKAPLWAPIWQKLPLARSDLEIVQDALPLPLSHDNILFLVQLFDGFYGLLHLGELVWLDNKSIQSVDKVTLCTSIVITDSYHSFLLRHHKSDVQFKGNTIVIQHTDIPQDCIQAMGRWTSESFWIYVCKNPALMHALGPRYCWLNPQHLHLMRPSEDN